MITAVSNSVSNQATLEERRRSKGPFLFSFLSQTLEGRGQAAVRTALLPPQPVGAAGGGAAFAGAAARPVLPAGCGLVAPDGDCHGNDFPSLTGPSSKASLSSEQLASLSHHFTRPWRLLLRGRPRHGARLKPQVPERRFPS